MPPPAAQAEKPLRIEVDGLFQSLSHQGCRFECTEIKTGADAIGAPKQHVIGRQMRLLDPPAMLRIPGPDAIVEASPDARPEAT